MKVVFLRFREYFNKIIRRNCHKNTIKGMQEKKSKTFREPPYISTETRLVPICDDGAVKVVQWVNRHRPQRLQLRHHFPPRP